MAHSKKEAPRWCGPFSLKCTVCERPLSKWFVLWDLYSKEKKVLCLDCFEVIKGEMKMGRGKQYNLKSLVKPGKKSV